MLESSFQSKLIKELKLLFPDSVVMKTDPTYIQGIPDILILYNNTWAALECKKSKRAAKRPNQEYYISMMDKMSFAKFIYPENKEEVLYELQRAFRS